MTAIPQVNDDSSAQFTLVCDDCGRSHMTAETADPTAWPQLWQTARNDGWRGPDWPIGPHLCPLCASTPRTDDRQ